MPHVFMELSMHIKMLVYMRLKLKNNLLIYDV